MAEQRFCNKCQKTLSEVKFYTYKNKTKCELCKDCLTMHINNYEPETFLWIMEMFDVPYIPAEWKRRREQEFEKAYAKAKTNGSKDPRTAAYNMVKGTGVVFGKYLSQMKLKQWAHYTWADTERLQQEAEEKAKLYGSPSEELQEKIDNMREAYMRGEISEAQWMTYTDINPANVEEMKSMEEEFLEGGGAEQASNAIVAENNPYPVNEHPFEVVAVPEVGADLTEDDKIYLALKWGRLYQVADWIWLEKKYNNFMESFDIQGEARIDTLVFICKTSLKMNQALDAGDIDTYQKLSKVYDAQMKAAKFTEAQRKEEKSDTFDAVGQIVYFAEKYKGAIPRHDITTPIDIVDEAIINLKRYNHDLFMSDTSLAQQFENYLKKREISEEQKNDQKKAKEQGDEQVMIEDKDIADYYENIKQQQEEDDELWD